MRTVKNSSGDILVGFYANFTNQPSTAYLLDHTAVSLIIELLNNKLHGLLPPGGLVSPPGGFASLLFDQGIP